MRILHIAPFNIAGVPITLVEAEVALGHYSRLVTLGHDRRDYREDICLNLPFLDSHLTRLAKKLFSNPAKLQVTNRKKEPTTTPEPWRPNGFFERWLIAAREKLWQPRIERLFNEIGFWDFDLYQLDGGLEFFRDGRIVKQLKEAGKKVICCYTGSDLRTRGVIAEIDRHSDLNIGFEFDHLELHPDISHVFFPFNPALIPPKEPRTSDVVRIGHAPTNRSAKGSDVIIDAINKLKEVYSVELVLIENLDHQSALRLKSTCDVFVDQVGDLGYGINSIESLAMAIPTCSCLASGFEQAYPGHPFIVIDEENIYSKLSVLLEKPDSLAEIGLRGKQWLNDNHLATRVVREIHRLLSKS